MVGQSLWLERILEAFDKVKSVPNRPNTWVALCPAHEDRTPSLSLWVAAGANCMSLRCRAGCSDGEVLSAAGLKVSDCYPPEFRKGGEEKPRVVAEYPYCDESGRLLYQCLRMEPKSFRQRRPVKDGWVWNLDGVRRVPYRLDRLARTPGLVVLVEGEKDVHTLEGLGWLASCNPMGAGKWLHEYSLHFRGRDVCVIPDNDEPGVEHARGVIGSLVMSGVRSVRYARLPGLKVKGDVTDWARATPPSRVRGEFQTVISSSIPYTV